MRSVMALNVIVNIIVGMLTFFTLIFFCGKSPTLCANFFFFLDEMRNEILACYLSITSW